MARLVTLETYSDIGPALVAKALLAQNGFYAELAARHHIQQNWLMLTALSGLRLHVLECDVTRCAEILKSPETDKPSVDPKLGACPSCGSADIFHGASWVIALTTLRLVALPLPVKTRFSVRRCRACDHRWRCTHAPAARG